MVDGDDDHRAREATVGVDLARLRAALASVAPVAEVGSAVDAVDVSRVTYDSRHTGPGALHCCFPGTATDGHDFAAEAVAHGASALLVERELAATVVPPTVPQLVTADARAAMAVAAAEVHGHPSRALTVVGITGTNGKTTTTFLLRSIFEAAGRPTAVLGTLTGPRTTPEAPDLQEWFVAQRDAGIEVVAMEVSSHALVLHRVDATRFAAAVFTNLGTDHLDLHHTAEEYFRAKASLFAPELSAVGVTNVDDAHGRLLFDASPICLLYTSPSPRDGLLSRMPSSA